MSWSVLPVFSSKSFIVSGLTFRSFFHLLIGFFVFLVLTCVSCLCILEINRGSAVSFAVIFSHSESCLFAYLIVSFAVKNF